MRMLFRATRPASNKIIYQYSNAIVFLNKNISKPL
jgi:hypothetical protein